MIVMVRGHKLSIRKKEGRDGLGEQRGTTRCFGLNLSWVFFLFQLVLGERQPGGQMIWFHSLDLPLTEQFNQVTSPPWASVSVSVRGKPEQADEKAPPGPDVL